VSFEKPREIAFRLLQEREARTDFIENLLEAELERSSLPTVDRALVQEIVYGVVRWQSTLDWLVRQKTSGKKQKTALLTLLRMGLYQLFWLSRIPDHAAVNETVELAKRSGLGAQSGFINAILRGYLRDRESTERTLTELRATRPALGYSHPEWLYDRWRRRLEPDQIAALLTWNNTPPRTFARVNLLRGDAGALREQWMKEHVEAKPAPVPWAADTILFELQAFPPLRTLASFLKGYFYIQDPSTLLAVQELDPQPGETILDYCAAPGGKTSYIAEKMGNRGRIVAQDVTDDRLALLRENCLRLGVTCVETVLPHEIEARIEASCDRILIDAPCSNTGVMRRRVDLRWRIREQEIARLTMTQLKLLREAAPRLKPGGTLVYSTCSLEPDENSAVIQEFLNVMPEMRLQRERMVTPWENNVDGAYVARLVRGSL
jgi:16S rRNA (cytosine967-C5)-methyltransferase